MSVLLWYGDGDDDAVSLGSVLNVFPAFSEVSKLLGGEGGFEELESVPGFAEQQVTPWWLSQVKAQARSFLQRYDSQCSPATKQVLERLSSIDLKPPR